MQGAYLAKYVMPYQLKVDEFKSLIDLRMHSNIADYGFQMDCKCPIIRHLLITGCIEECSSFRVGQAATFLGWQRVKRNTAKASQLLGNAGGSEEHTWTWSWNYGYYQC